MYISRTAEKILKEYATSFKSVAVIGPRQSGKTTLIRHVFPLKPYVNLENPDTREFAATDPRRFLNGYPDGAILDEVQKVPVLFSYLQQILDEKAERGLFILSGSTHFLMMEHLAQTLAGRIGLIKLLPMSIKEAEQTEHVSRTPDDAMIQGGYPEICVNGVSPLHWLGSYINTYIERDVRQLLNVHDTGNFFKFVKLCAGNVGSLLNLSRLGADCGIDQKTARAWIGILETSFIVYRLMPHHNNFRKRLIKTPKLYFYDTGLACRLLGIESSVQLSTNLMRGHLFENMVISDLLKQRFNQGLDDNIYFWRSSSGHEVDVIIDKAGKLFPVEIKSGVTIAKDWFTGLLKWKKLASDQSGTLQLLYGGTDLQKRGEVNVVSWRHIEQLLLEE